MKITRIVTHHAFPHEVADIYLKGNFIAVGYVYDENIARFGNKDVIMKHRGELDPEFDNWDLSYQSNRFLEFRDNVHDGDIIIAYETDNIVTAIGRVKGEMYFKEEKLNIDGSYFYPNRYNMKWCDEPRRFHRMHFISKIADWIKLRGTIKITHFDIDNISDLFTLEAKKRLKIKCDF